jgi:hypothetical protein
MRRSYMLISRVRTLFNPSEERKKENVLRNIFMTDEFIVVVCD